MRLEVYLILTSLPCIVVRPPPDTQDEIPAKAFFEAQLVGCLLTNDRLAAAKFVDEPSCRLCHATKESLPAHEFGRNFELLGIVEHPWSVAAARLKISSFHDIVVSPWDCNQPRVSLWTDGSVMWPEHFLLSCAGYAVVDKHGQVILRGPVHHWSLCSYTAELWALVNAFCFAATPVEIRTDCETLVKHVLFMIKHDCVHPTWPHLPWWKGLHHVWQQRHEEHVSPLEVAWIPSHVLEHIPLELIDCDMATAHSTTQLDIANNRHADHAAKRAALACSLVHPDVYSCLLEATLERQTWLTSLSKLVGISLPQFEEPEEDDNDEMQIQPQQHFPRLPWNSKTTEFPCVFLGGWPASVVANANILVDDWLSFGRFIAALRWKEGPELMCSYTELAVFFAFQGHKCSIMSDEHVTFRQLIQRMKNLTATARKQGLAFAPGHHDSRAHHSRGKTMPSSSICGAAPYLSDDFLFFLVEVT